MKKISKQARATSIVTFVIILIVVSIIGTMPAIAESLMERGTGEGLRVAFFNYIPFAYEDNTGTLTGTDVDTLKYVLNKMGVKIASTGATEWGNLIPGLNANRFDVVAAGMFVTPKRCKAVKFSETTFGIKQGLVVKKGNPDGVTNYEDVAKKGLKIAVLTGSAQLEWARVSGIAESNIMQIPDNPTGIAAVRSGRACAYAIDAPGVREVVKGVPEQDLEGVPPFQTVAGKPAMPHGAFAFRKQDADFVNKFDEILTSFVGTPEHIAILEKHGMKADEVPVLSTEQICSQSN